MPEWFYLRARYYDAASGQFISRDPVVATTREPYSYANDNPLNATDPTGLFGWDDLARFGTSMGHIGHAIETFPGAAAHAAQLNVESVISTAFYAPYWAAYHMNHDWAPWTPKGFKSAMLNVQHWGLEQDKAFDRYQACTGYPGATENDEAQTVNFFPSLILPQLDSDGNWSMGKFTYGLTTYGPGRGPTGHEDFAD